MILLDTNVISALMRQDPDPTVIAWLDGQPAESIWTTSITVFEIEYGLALLPEGRRRTLLTDAFGLVLREDLGGRVALLDQPSALAASQLAAMRQKAGRTVEFRDTLIAGIAQARRAAIATRNSVHFQELDTPVISPWQAG